MQWILDHLTKERGVVTGAPFATVLVLVFGALLGYWFESTLTAEHIATLNTMIQERDGKISGLEKTISDRLDKVEKQLSEQQVSSIKSNIKTNPASVDIIGGTADKPDPRVDQFKSIFQDSGWSVDTKSITQPNQSKGITLRTPDDKAAHTLEKALNDAGVTYETVKPNDASGAQDFQLKPSTF